MNEVPAPGPDQIPAPPSRQSKFAAMFGLGIVLIVVSVLVCRFFQSPVPFLGGTLIAFLSLFFRGYRGIFVGYISCVGLALLGTIIYCANHPLHF
jgi:hypothetical protein